MVVTGATSSAGSKGKDNVIANRKAGDALPVRSTMPAPSCPSTTGMRTSSRPSRITISGYDTKVRFTYARRRGKIPEGLLLGFSA